MKKKHIIPMLLVFVGLATLSFTLATGVTLRLQPKQGQTYTATSKTNAMTMIEMQGQSMNMSQSMEIRQSFNAKTVTETQSDFETQIEAIKMSMSQMGMKLEYDSEHPEKTSPMLAGQTKDFEKVLNNPISISYDATGHIVGDSIDMNINQLSNVVLELPEKEVTVGSKWNSKKTQHVNNTEIVVNMEYTVTAISKKSVDVSFTGTVDSKDVTGTYNGTASIHPQTGMVTASSTKSNITMTLNEQGMSLPITIVSTSTIEVK